MSSPFLCPFRRRLSSLAVVSTLLLVLFGALQFCPSEAPVALPPDEVHNLFRATSSTTTTTTTKTTTTTATTAPETTEKSSKSDKWLWWHYVVVVVGSIAAGLVVVGTYFIIRMGIKKRGKNNNNRKKTAERKKAKDAALHQPYDKFDDPEYAYFDLNHVKMKGPAKIQAELPLPTASQMLSDTPCKILRGYGYNARKRITVCEVWSIGSDSAAGEVVVDKNGKVLTSKEQKARKDSDHEDSDETTGH